MRRNVRLLSAFNFCNDFRVYAPVMVIYFQQVTGSFALATLLFSIAKIAGSAFEVPTGVLSDRVGRRITMLLGQLASVAAVAFYGLGNDFTSLAVGAVLEGLAFSFFSGNNEALLFETLKADGDEASYALWQGRVSSMFQFALAASAALSIVVLGVLSLRATFILTLIPQTLGLAITFFIAEPQRSGDVPVNIYAHLREAFAGFVRDARLRDLSVASMLGFAIGEAKHMVHPAFFALFWPAWALGAASVLVFGLAALGFRASGALIRRFGETGVLVGGSFASIAAGLAGVALPTVASPAVVSGASFFYGPSQVAQGSLMQKAFSDTQRATMASLISLGGNILFAAAVFAIGLAADRFGARFALLGAEILTIPVTLLYWRLYRSA